MSLILEALKKSEQQRRLGEAPTLGSPLVATRRRRSLLPVLAILIIAAVAAGWWMTRQKPTPAPPPSAAATSAPLAATTPAPAAPSKNLPAPAAPSASAGNHAPERPRITGYAAAQQKADQERRAAALANATHAATPAPPSAPIKPSPEPGTAAPVAPSATTDKPTSADTAAANATPAPAKATPSASPAAVPPPNAKADSEIPATATATAAKPAAESGALPTIWDLPYSTRKDLPAIDLSMHVFSADPKQRFVVIKGDRHVEGDELGQDLVLREIRQDGLVLVFKGQAFLFPRNGR